MTAQLLPNSRKSVSFFHQWPAAQAWICRENIRWFEFACLLLIAIIANIYFVSAFSISIDDELAAVRTDPGIWAAQGRFGVYLVEYLLFPQSSLPYSPYLFLSVCLAVGYILLVRTHGYMPSWKTYSGFGVFVTFPTWFLIGEFAANVPSTGIGFLLVAIAAYLVHGMRDGVLFRKLTIGRAVAAVLLLAFAAGLYQSLLVMFLVILMGTTLVATLCSQAPTRELIWAAGRNLLQAGIVLAASGVLYVCLNKGALVLLGVQPSYIDSFINLNYLRAPLWLAHVLVKRAAAVYAGSSEIYGAAMSFAGPTAAAAILCVLQASGRRLLPSMLLLGVLGTPFILNILAGPSGLPLRSLVALSYVTWLLVMLILTCKTTWLACVGVILTMIYQLQILNVNSQYIATANVVQAQDRMVANAIGLRILELQVGMPVAAPVLIDVFGYRKRELPSVYAAAPTSTTAGSFFGWNKGNIHRIAAYMRVIGFNQVQALPDSVRTTLTPEFTAMPIWPLAGSVKKVGQHYLVKLGDEADAVHATPAYPD